MERLGEVKLPTGCTQMMLALPCVPELTPDSTRAIFGWNDKPTFKGSCKFILSCRMTCNPIQCIELHDCMTIHMVVCLGSITVLESFFNVVFSWFLGVRYEMYRNVLKCIEM